MVANDRGVEGYNVWVPGFGDRGTRQPDGRGSFARGIQLYRRALETHQEAIDVFARVMHRWSGGVHEGRLEDAAPSSPHDAPTAAGPAAVGPAARAFGEATPVAAAVPGLTRRQREVAALIAAGYSNAQIAEKLVMTNGTAANHVAAILRRLGVANRAQIAAAVVHAALTRPAAQGEN